MTSERVSYDTYRPVYPTPAGLITSVDADGRPNIITLGEVFNISIRQPVICGVAIRPATYSHGLISAQGDYVINLPTGDMLDKVWACGQVSGRDADKFAQTGLTPLPATHVKPPLIAECPVNIECKVVGIQTIGDHDLFLGEVRMVHVSPGILGPDGKIDPAKMSTVIMAGMGFFDLGKRLDV
ncbi:MAG: flavin reductase family protein [Armatimonadetes bacterium]|jgi:flavin reductase (DIM6/NTAB) family NADH-FMN oxidoreductase RutF|nr:flavin reductase family protein [Armatimonadota bacterium]